MTNIQTTPRLAQLSAVRTLEYAEFLAADGRPHQSKLHYLHAIAIDDTPRSRLEYATFLLNIGDFSAAGEVLQELHRESCDDANPALQSVVAHQFAVLARLRGDFARANSWQQRSVQMAAAQTEATQAISTADLTNLANDAFIAGDLELAESLIRRSLAVELERGDLEGQATDWGTLGLILGRRGETATALECLWRAHDLHERLGDGLGVATDLLNLSQISGCLGRWDAAARLLKHALSTAEPLQLAHLLPIIRRRHQEAERILAVADRDPRRN